jgi:putative ABC transport system permease protein
LEFQRRALERIKSLPGVETAAVTNTLPLSGSFNLPIEIDGQGSEMMSVEARIVTPEYFQLMALPVKAGRAFGENDTGSSPSVVMVNEAFERKYLTDADPLSRRVIVARVLGDTTSRQIVGVTRDAKHLTIKAEPTPVMFMPVTQVPEKIMLATMTVSPTRFLVRTTVEPLSLSAAVKREVLALDPVLPMTNVRSMDQIVSRSIAPDRFNMFLLGMFAVIGLALAMIGVYATMNYSAIQRTHEIGIRMALGASSTDVLRLILKRGVVVAVIGIVIGLGGAFALAPLIRNLLFGVGATDPVTLAIVAAVLATATLLACFIPARRATKVDPIIALRTE